MQKKFIWILPSSRGTVFCFHAFTSPTNTSLSHHNLVPFLSCFNKSFCLFPPYISFQETLIDFALTSTDIWVLWHDAENQTVVKYINFEQYGSLTSVILPYPKQIHTQKRRRAFYVEQKSNVAFKGFRPGFAYFLTYLLFYFLLFPTL